MLGKKNFHLGTATGNIFQAKVSPEEVEVRQDEFAAKRLQLQPKGVYVWGRKKVKANLQAPGQYTINGKSKLYYQCKRKAGSTKGKGREKLKKVQGMHNRVIGDTTDEAAKADRNMGTQTQMRCFQRKTCNSQRIQSKITRGAKKKWIELGSAKKGKLGRSTRETTSKESGKERILIAFAK